MKYLILFIVVLGMGAGCANAGQTYEMENSLFRNKITCEEKGRKYIEREDWSPRPYEFTYNRDLDTCLVFINNTDAYYHTGSEEEYLIYDILGSKKEIFSSKSGVAKDGIVYQCYEDEKGCFPKEEFMQIKNKLFK